MSYSGRIAEAFAYALALHREQFRKGTDIPYITHLMAVSSIVGEHGGDGDLVIAALLHDAVEDQGGLDTLTEIKQKFGEEVARIVDGCTDAYEDPKPDWRPRKEAYLAHLDEVDDHIRLVSAADKVHNARAIVMDLRVHGASLWDRFNGGKEGTLWYYEQLGQAFIRLGPKLLGEEIVRQQSLMLELG